MKIKNKSSIPNKYLLIILLFVCVILLGIERFTDTGGPLRFIANYTVLPMQKGISYAGMWLSDMSDNFETMKEMKKEKKK